MVDTASAEGDLIRYWAFISYSRRDRQWALWLQRRLESFKVEKSLRQKIRSPGLRSDRLCPVFRDDDELGASPDLDRAIRSRLDRSHSLIVVASPRSAHSIAVKDEIDHFLTGDQSKRLLVALIDGEPMLATDNNGSSAAFSSAFSKCPKPLWVDFRSGAEPRKRAFIRLVAGLLNIRFDALWDRERRRLRRQLFLRSMIGGLTAAVLIIAFLVTDLLQFRAGLLQRAEHAISSQYMEDYFQEKLDLEARRSLLAAMAPQGSLVKSRAQEREAASLIRIAGLQARILDAHSIIEAIQFTSNARIIVAGDYAGHIWVWETNTGKRLAQLSIISCREDDRTFDADCAVEKIAISQDGTKLAALSRGGYLAVFELPSTKTLFERNVRLCAVPGTATAKVHHPCPARALFFTAENTAGAVTGDGVLQYFDIEEGGIVQTVQLHPGRVIAVAVNDTSDTMLSITEEGEFATWSTSPLSIKNRGQFPNRFDLRMLTSVALTPDGSSALIGFAGGYVSKFSLADGSELTREFPSDPGNPSMIDELADDPTTFAEPAAIAMSNNGAWKAFGYQGSNIELWNLKPSASTIVLVGHEAGLNILVFSSDSKLLASGAEDGTVRVWRVGDNAQNYTRADLLLLAGQGQLAFSPSQWNEEWRLWLRNPDPALWHGLGSWRFWQQLPSDIYHAFTRSYAKQKIEK